MMSFRESLETKKTMAIARECFTEMARRNVDPESFVAWLESSLEERPEMLESEGGAWLETELKLNEAGFLKSMFSNIFKSKPTDPLQAAMSKVQDLITRSNRQGSRLSQEKIQNMLHSMLSLLKSRQFPTPASQAAKPGDAGKPAAPGKPPAPAPGARPGAPRANIDLSAKSFATGPGGTMPVGSGTARKPQAAGARTTTQRFESSNGVSNIERMLLETRIKSLCFLLSDTGHDPMAFAQWYTSQRSLDESWLGGAISGIKGGLAGGWDRLMGGGEGSVLDAFRKGYTTSRDANYDQDDIKAMDDAMRHLSDFAKNLPADQFADVQKQIADLVTSLRDASTAKMPQQKPQEPRAGEQAKGQQAPQSDKPGSVYLGKVHVQLVGNTLHAQGSNASFNVRLEPDQLKQIASLDKLEAVMGVGPVTPMDFNKVARSAGAVKSLGGADVHISKDALHLNKIKIPMKPQQVQYVLNMLGMDETAFEKAAAAPAGGAPAGSGTPPAGTKPSGESAPPASESPSEDYSKDENVVNFIKSSDKMEAKMGIKLPPIFKKIMAQWDQIEKNPDLRQKIVSFTKQELMKKPDETKNFHAINGLIMIPKGSKEIRLKSVA